MHADLVDHILSIVLDRAHTDIQVARRLLDIEVEQAMLQEDSFLYCGFLVLLQLVFADSLLALAHELLFLDERYVILRSEKRFRCFFPLFLRLLGLPLHIKLRFVVRDGQGVRPAACASCCAAD